MKLFYVHFLLNVILKLGAFMAEYFYARANPKCLNTREVIEGTKEPHHLCSAV